MTATLEKPETKIKVDEKKEQGIVTKFHGTKKLIDPETGVVYEVEFVEKQVKHKFPGGWRRVFTDEYNQVIIGLYNKARRIEVVEFIMANLNSENQLTLTQKQVIEQTKIAKQTVVETYKHLVKVNFMKKVGAVFIENPKIIAAFGSDKKNGAILTKYCDYEPSFDEIEPSFA